MRKLMNKQERLDSANEFIAVIAGCGRHFFSHEGFIARLELSSHGRVFFIDQYTKKRIYTHRRHVRWDGFTSGGTMKSLIESLRDFIIHGYAMRSIYFQPEISEGIKNPWGYGDDILIVKAASLRLGVAV